MVAQDRYGSASEVILEGLRLAKEREAKLQALRKTIDASIAQGGSFTSEEVMAAVEAKLNASSRFHRGDSLLFARKRQEKKLPFQGEK